MGDKRLRLQAELADRLGEGVGDEDGGWTRPGLFSAFVLKSMERGAKITTIVTVSVTAAGDIPDVPQRLGAPLARDAFYIQHGSLNVD